MLPFARLFNIQIQIALMAEFHGALDYKPDECGFESHLRLREKFLGVFCKNILSFFLNSSFWKKKDSNPSTSKHKAHIASADLSQLQVEWRSFLNKYFEVKQNISS